jgi:hypothetical protein
MQEPGDPRAVENLVKLKNGRMGVRFDYDPLAVTTQSGGALTLYDLAEFDGRLLGFGQVAGALPLPTTSPQDVIEYLGRPLYGWRPTDAEGEPRLALATAVRNVGRVPTQALPVDTMDVAAGGGLVCEIWMIPSSGAFIHIFHADSDATVLLAFISGMTFPRVVCTGTIFFITGVVAGDVVLRRYNPAADTALTTLTNPLTGGTAPLCLDMSLAHEGTSFWIAIGKAANFQIRGYGTTGTQTHSFTGAAVSTSKITVFAESTRTATLRIHVLAVITGTNVLDWYTYLTAGTLETGSANAFAKTTDRQASMAVRSSVVGSLVIVFQDVDDVAITNAVNNTHTFSALIHVDNIFLTGKLANVGSHCFAACTVKESITSDRSALMMTFSAESTNPSSRPCSFIDRLQALNNALVSLPNLATDVSTGKSYWAHLLCDEDCFGQPELSELEFCSTARRQTAQVGEILYIAGGCVQAFDGRVVAEAGFFERPFVVTATGSTSTGALDLLGIYQMVYVYETLDSKGRRIQGPPSDVFEVALAGTENTITATVVSPHSFRAQRSANFMDGAVKIVGYRTTNTNDGNLTFQRDTQVVLSPGDELGTSKTLIHSQSDVNIEDNEILYTQGARGSLSGPLPFESPEPCISLAASADRIVSGPLPNCTTIQESRGQFTAEELNWSDTIGFQRDGRGRVLAVARLDERRIVFTAREIFELDGPGLDDNGGGDIGAPRRLPSDVGLYGGQLGWRSIVECSDGILFQGLSNQIFLLPRGGGGPVEIGLSVEDKLAEFPTVTSATYLPLDTQVRFTCNNLAGTDSIVLIYDVTWKEWFTEGPFGTTITAGAKYQDRAVLLRGNVVYQQRLTHPPLAFIANAWRSGTVHPYGPGEWGRVYAVHFYGEFRGNCTLTCVVTFDDLVTETLVATTVSGLSVGDPYSHKFTPNQVKCESIRVDFQVTNLAGAATEGLAYHYWALDLDPAGKSALKAPAQMS